MPLAGIIPEEVLALGSEHLPFVVGWLHRRAGSNPYLLSRIQALDAHALAFGNRLRERDFDVLFAGSCSWSFAPPVSKYCRIPSVLYLQEPNRALYEARPWLPWLAEDSKRETSLRTVRHWLGSSLRLQPIRTQAREEQRNASAL